MRWARSTDEKGASAVIIALLMVALLTMVAIVVDLGAARQQVRDNQSVADFAALAGGAQLPNFPRQACTDAWGYIKANSPDMPGAAAMACNSFPIACTTTTAATDTTSTSSGGYTVTFRYPIPDAELVPTRVRDGVTAIPNQHQCERMKVDVARQRPQFFNGVVGGGFRTLMSTATVRSVQGTTNPALVALLLLDPFGCNALTTSGQGKIQIYASADTPQRPGKIGIDSDGTLTNAQNDLGPNERSCDSNNTWVVDPKGTNFVNSQIKSFPTDDLTQPGSINMYAFSRGQQTCLISTVDPPNLKACDQGDVTALRLDPQPIRVALRSTREQIDNVYNCQDPHPRPDFPKSTTRNITLNGCPDAGTRVPWITHLMGEVGATSPCPTSLPCPPNGGTFCNLQSPDASCPAITDYPTGVPCSLQGNKPTVNVPVGNWYIDCVTFGVKNNVNFLGGNVVARGTISSESSTGLITFNTQNPVGSLSATCQAAIQGCAGSSSTRHAWVYIRDGDIVNTAGGSMTFHNTMAYIAQGNDTKRLNFTAQGTLTWDAPLEGPFLNLLLWSESAAEHRLGGQSTLATSGIFFMPYANPMNYNGGSCIGALGAQFISFRMTNSGQGCLNLQPSYSRVAPIKFIGSNLIR